MALTKYKLGQLIEQSDERNADERYGIDDVRGISIQKKFIFTKADMTGVSLRPYKLVRPNTFSYVTVTSRNGEKITLGYNDTGDTYIVSSSYIVFRVVDEAVLLPEYLFIYFNRPEFDRFARFNSWGSARETFDWDTMCDIDIELPSVEIQQKFVDVYKAMVANQKCYENGLSDLKLTCDAYIEDLRRKMPCEKIGPYIQQSDRRNDMGLTQDDVRGITTAKELIPTKASMNGVRVDNYKLVEPGAITYVPDTSRRGDKISLAMNNTGDTYLVSSISSVFTTDREKLLPDYLMLFFSRAEFDRYTRFHSWGSARETFNWDDMQAVKVPIPDIHVQQAIVNIYKCYLKRKEINERLKAQIKDLCPILIRGSLQEGGKTP